MSFGEEYLRSSSNVGSTPVCMMRLKSAHLAAQVLRFASQSANAAVLHTLYRVSQAPFDARMIPRLVGRTSHVGIPRANMFLGEVNPARGGVATDGDHCPDAFQSSTCACNTKMKPGLITVGDSLINVRHECACMVSMFANHTCAVLTSPITQQTVQITASEM